jgi:acetaldehyde dehydrogenase (acetylating)
MASNRGTVRKAFAALLTTALGSLTQAVYDYRMGDFGTQNPVVTVSSAGIQRQRATMHGSRATMYLQVDVFVLYADGVTWGEDDAEDRVDDIEAAIAGVIDANQANANWYALTQMDRSQRIDVEIGGVEYIREMITVAVEVFG